MNKISLDTENFMVNATQKDNESYWYVNIYSKHESKYYSNVLWTNEEMAMRISGMIAGFIKSTKSFYKD